MVRVGEKVDLLTDEQINLKYNLKSKDMKNLRISKTVYPDGFKVEHFNDPEFEMPKGALEMTKRERNVFVGAIFVISLLIIAIILV